MEHVADRHGSVRTSAVQFGEFLLPHTAKLKRRACDIAVDSNAGHAGLPQLAGCV
jgi:hypothetical protein